MLVDWGVQVIPSPEVSTVPPWPTAIKVAPLVAMDVRLMPASEVAPLTVETVQVMPSGL